MVCFIFMSTNGFEDWQKSGHHLIKCTGDWRRVILWCSVFETSFNYTDHVYMHTNSLKMKN